MRAAWAVLFAACATIAGAQGTRSVSVRVTTAGGQPVPYAVLSVDGAPFRIADANGVVTVALAARDSVPLIARRIGFRPLDGWARRADSADAFEAVMAPIAATMDTVRILAVQSTPLSRTGFYDRVERVRKSAMLGEFISPEELETRNLSRLSDMLQGRMYSRITTLSVKGQSMPYAQGRAGCAMNIIVDGQFVKNTTQDLQLNQVPTSLRPDASGAPFIRPDGSGFSRPLIGLDDIASGRAIMGIEIYPSIAGAPVELIPTASRGACGLIAIWTGPRK